MVLFIAANGLSITFLPFLSALSNLCICLFFSLPFLLAAIFSNLSTIDLIEQCSNQSRDWEHCWQEFENRFGDLISIYIVKEYRRYSKNINHRQLGETIKDLRQDVYIKLLKNNAKALKAFKGNNDKSFFAYLYTISRNVVINHLKKNNRDKVAIPGSGDKTGIENNEIELLCFETTEHIDLAFLQESLLQILREDYKSRNCERDILIFQLFYFQGMSANDIQSDYNVDLSISGIETVANRVKQSLQKRVF